MSVRGGETTVFSSAFSKIARDRECGSCLLTRRPVFPQRKILLTRPKRSIHKPGERGTSKGTRVADVFHGEIFNKGRRIRRLFVSLNRHEKVDTDQTEERLEAPCLEARRVGPPVQCLFSPQLRIYRVIMCKSKHTAVQQDKRNK